MRIPMRFEESHNRPWDPHSWEPMGSPFVRACVEKGDYPSTLPIFYLPSDPSIGLQASMKILISAYKESGRGENKNQFFSAKILQKLPGVEPSSPSIVKQAPIFLLFLACLETFSEGSDVLDVWFYSVRGENLLCALSPPQWINAGSFYAFLFCFPLRSLVVCCRFTLSFLACIWGRIISDFQLQIACENPTVALARPSIPKSWPRFE